MLVAVATSCTDDAVYVGPEQEPDVSESDDVVTLNFSVEMPEPVSATSRAMGDVPAYDKLKLYCLVFQDNGKPSSNFFVDKVEATREMDKAHDIDELRYIPFKVKLIATTEKAILHFVAINTADSVKPEDNPLSQRIEFAPENVIMPRLTTTGGRDAYWQRIVLGCRISTETEEQIKNLVSEFSPVPLIRNFARVSVELSEDLDKKTVTRDGTTKKFFELEGFCVVNTLDRGTIAAFNGQSTISFPSFGVSGEEVGDGDHKHKKFTPYTYDEITAHGYTGSVAAGSKLNTAPPTSPDEFNIEPKYIYERPFTETLHTYIIVKGKYNGLGTETGTVDGTGETSYYKLDIGRTDDRGLFRFTNMLRNFDFKIVINNVETNGYKTIADAANGMIYNNNLSASIESRPLLSISDGHDMMYVNMTSYVCVDGEPIDLYYRYFLLKDNTLDNDDQIFNDDSGNNLAVDVDGNPVMENGVQAKAVIWNDAVDGCVPGKVVKTAARGDRYEDDITQGTNKIKRVWEHVVITPNTPTDEQKVQMVTLYRPKGLSRTITLYLQTRRNADKVYVYPGRWDHRENNALNSGSGLTTEDEGKVSEKAGANLTIFFELEQGLPKAMFPLEFVIESNRQNIENDKNGTIVVQSGPSMFGKSDDESGDESGDIRIQYVKTVTWNEYDPDNKSDDPNSREDNYDADGNYIGNVVRCRFLTITDLDADDINQRETTVKIRNKYFNEFEVKFSRPEGYQKSPEEPDV